MFVESNKQEFRFRTVKRNKREMSVCARVVFGTVLMTMVAATPVLAAPTGGSVQRGSANIAGQGTDSTVITQYSPRVDITWGSFDTGSTQSVTFDQYHGGSAVAINRVTGGTRTQFDGMLSAQGQVIIINNQGITFGKTSQINVGALMATTAEPLGLDGFVGNGWNGGNSLSFAGNSTASVINYGDIFANGGQGVTLALRDEAGVGGFVVLAAAHVVNEGTIQANAGISVDGAEGGGGGYNEGHVELVSTQDFSLNKDQRGDGLVNLSSTPEAKVGDGVVTNTGTLRSRSGNVYLRANMAQASIVDATVNMDGIVDADALGSTPWNGGTILVTSTTDIKFDDFNGDGVGADIHAIGGAEASATFIAADNIESVDGSPAVNIDVEAGYDYYGDASVRMVAGDDITLNAKITVKADALNESDSSAEAYAQLDIQAGNEGTFEDPLPDSGNLTLNGNVTVAATATSDGSTDEEYGAIARAQANLDAAGSVTVTTGDETVAVTATATALDEGEAQADASLNIGTHAGGPVNSITFNGPAEVTATATASRSNYDADADALFVLTTDANGDGDDVADGSVTINGDATVDATATAVDDANAFADLWVATRAVEGYTEDSGTAASDGSVTIIGNPSVTATATSTGEHWYADAEAGLHIASIEVSGEGYADGGVDGSVTITGDSIVEARADGGEGAYAGAVYEFGSELTYAGSVPERLQNDDRVSGIQIDGHEGYTDGSINLTGNSSVTADAKISNEVTGYAGYVYANAYFGLRSYSHPYTNLNSFVNALSGQLDGSINITGDTRVTANTSTDFGMFEGSPAEGYLSDGAESNAVIEFYGRGFNEAAEGMVDASVNIMGLTEATATNNVLGNVGYSSYSNAYVGLMEEFSAHQGGSGHVDMSLNVDGPVRATAKNTTSGNSGYGAAFAEIYTGSNAVFSENGTVDQSITVGELASLAELSVGGDLYEGNVYSGVWLGEDNLVDAIGTDFELEPGATVVDASVTTNGAVSANAKGTVTGDIIDVDTLVVDAAVVVRGTGYHDGGYDSDIYYGGAFYAYHPDGVLDVSVSINDDVTAKAEGSAASGHIESSSLIDIGNAYWAGHYGGGFIDATIASSGNTESIAMASLSEGDGGVAVFAETEIGHDGYYGDGFLGDGIAVDDAISLSGSTLVRADGKILGSGSGEDDAGVLAVAGLFVRTIGPIAGEDAVSTGSIEVGAVTVESIADNHSTGGGGYVAPGKALADSSAAIIGSGQVDVSGTVKVAANADAVDAMYGSSDSGVNANAWLTVAAGAVVDKVADLNITGPRIQVSADANLTGEGGSGSGSAGGVSANANAVLVASNEVNIGSSGGTTDTEVTANASSAQGYYYDGAMAYAQLNVIAGARGFGFLGPIRISGPIGPIGLDSDLSYLPEMFASYFWREGDTLRHADLNYVGDITVLANADATENYESTAYAGALSLAVLLAGDDVNIDTDPVKVIANADIVDDPEAIYSSTEAEAAAGLLVLAGLNGFDETVDPADVIGNISIRGDMSSQAHANDPNAVPFTDQPEQILNGNGGHSEAAYALTALVPEVDVYEGTEVLGSLTIRGRDPLARADTNPVPDGNLALVQQRTSAGAACWDGVCDGGPIPEDPLAALEFMYGVPDFEEWDTSLSVAGLILAGNPINIGPKAVRPNITDRVVNNNAPNPALPGSRGLRFDQFGNMIPADSLAEGALPPIPPGFGSTTPLLAGDPTALLAPTAAGPGESDDDFCSQLVSGACEQQSGGEGGNPL